MEVGPGALCSLLNNQESYQVGKTFKGCPAIWKSLPLVVTWTSDDESPTEPLFPLGQEDLFKGDFLTLPSLLRKASAD
jgi:hypothetical protein